MTTHHQPGDADAVANDIAIIGMACRFPGARSPDEFWTLLSEGKEARTELTTEELRAAGVPASLTDDPAYVKSGMFLADMEQFDPGFFGFSPLDGRILDPQHRHFLECAWEALEDAAYDPARYDGAIGVFAGSGQNAYLPRNLLTNPDLVREVGLFLLRHTGNDKDFLATRASYCFDLKGPSVNVQTACSTSLVAVHYAVQSLLAGECDMALAGGVTIELPHRQGYLFKEGEILAPDGHCRPFDASAAGTLFGSGVGVVMLKRLEDALADRDHIHAVIKGTAVNNDGAGKISYLAPSVDGQSSVIEEAISVAGIDPRSVTYVEAHGTGTRLGDPIEVAALAAAYGTPGGPKQYCGLGSVKSNIGHLDTAAGIASLIKVALSMKHRRIPATLHYSSPNPAIDFAATPFFVNASLRPWSGPSPLRGGVSSLGVGGTNAHVILEEAPAAAAVQTGPASQIMVLSARTPSALARNRARLAQYLRGEGRNHSLADIAHTLAIGRRRFALRAAFVAGDHEAAARLLDGEESRQVTGIEAPEAERTVAYMFAGGGAQYPNMGRHLYETAPHYKQSIDECLRLLKGRIDFDLRDLLFPRPGDERRAAEELRRPSRSLPALFVTQYAQARLWQSWGIEPGAMIGHSMGENTAACIAGVFSLDDALGLVTLRGRLLESLPRGGMLSVSLAADRLAQMLPAGLDIAARNSTDMSVVSGPISTLDAFEEELRRREINCQRVHIDVAAHSAMLDPILPAFGDYLRSIRLNRPSVPFLSNLTGDWITPEQACDPDYWVRHLRRTVDFEGGMGRLLEADRFALLEIGPGRILSSLAGMHAGKRPGQAIVTSMRHVDDATPDLDIMLAAIGRLWQANVALDWRAFYGNGERRRLPLPTYGFDHSRCWTDPGRGHDDSREATLDEWIHVPAWAPRPLPTSPACQERACVIGRQDTVAPIADALSSRFEATIRVVIGAAFERRSAQDYVIANTADDYQRLLDALSTGDSRPLNVYLATAADPTGDHVSDALEQTRHLTHLGKAIADTGSELSSVIIVTRGAMRVPGDDALPNPGAASIAGAMGSFATELRLPVGLVDLPTTATDPADYRMLAGERPGDDCPVIAYRHHARYERRFEHCRLASPTRPNLREGGVYLITGGLGGLGIALAKHLLASHPVRIALLARRAPPAAAARPFYMAGSRTMSERVQEIEQLRESRIPGAEVMIVQADVADHADLARAVESIEKEWGPVNGVFHTAGVLSDTLMAQQPLESIERTFAPKVQGTTNLGRVFAARAPDFLLLFSSTSAFGGLPGQTAYGAANAFMDAWAHSRAGIGVNAVAVDWSAWKDAGMAAALAAPPRPWSPGIAAEAREHVADRSYRRLVDGRDWVISEHRTKRGIALLPGTGFIELACRAISRVLPETGVIALSDLQLLAPLVLDEDDRVVVCVTFQQDGRFEICSSADAESADRGVWKGLHARGSVSRQTSSQDARLDIPSLQARCAPIQASPEKRVDHAQMDFGARWHCVAGIGYGKGEALVHLTLAPQCLTDLDEHPVHPALLDMATGAATGLVSGLDPQSQFLVPQAYRSIRWHAPLGRELYSHLRVAVGSTDDTPMFDIVVADPTGRVLVEILGFTLIRLGSDALDRLAVERQPRRAASSVDALLANGIAPADGMEAIQRILAHPGLPQVVVSPLPPGYGALRFDGTPAPADETAAAGDAPGMDRTGLSTEYVAPVTELEKTLASLWQEGLGVTKVGVEDNFFELGGHSMLMIQLVGRMKKQTGVSLPLSRLYTNPTISGWVRLKADAGTQEPAGAVKGVKRVSRDAYRVTDIPRDAG